MDQDLAVVGKSFPRMDGVDKATGRAVYGQDLRRPGMLFGKLLRSKYPHALILSIDTSRAEALPGVKAVVTGRDLLPGYIGGLVKDETPLAVDRVRYLGETVAAVAAVDEDTARRALDLIEVRYQELPAVFDPEEAKMAGAPILHPDLASYEAANMVKGSGNVCTCTTICKGDVEEGFRRADLVFEDTFRTQMFYHAYLEPHAALAEVSENGKVTVWATTQSPFMMRAQLAEVFHLPMSRIRVIASRCGGGFGGKSKSLVGPAAILLAMKAHRPVKIALSMNEDMISGHPRHPTTIRLKTGVMNDGTLVSREASLVLDTGAYSDFGPQATSMAVTSASGPYKIPNVKLEGSCVYTNNISSGSCRAPGVVQATFAIESQMDIIARRLGMDPVEFRLKNAIAEGDTASTGQVYGPIGLKAVLTTLQDFLKRQGPAGPGRAWGVACAKWGIGGTSSSAQVKINEDGTAVLHTGSVDIGPGSDTVLCQIAAEELGLRMEDMTIVSGDTDATPFDMGTIGNRTTFTMGTAVRLAAADARRQLEERGAEVLEANPRDLESVDRKVRVKGSPDRAVPIAQLAAVSHVRGGPILGRGSYMPVSPAFNANMVQGAAPATKPGDDFSAQAAEVEVDPETGTIKVLRVVVAQDIGCTINPLLAEGQVEGSIGFGIGFARSEEVHSQHGRILNPFLNDYRTTRPVDMPAIDVIMVEDVKGEGPFGAKGLGEIANVPTGAAIVNAVYNAVGVRIKDLPVTPEKIRAALREQEKREE